MKKINSHGLSLFLLISIICFSSAPKAVAQNIYTENKPALAWINVGYGVIGGEGLVGLSLITNAQYSSKYGLFGVRFLKAGNALLQSKSSNYIDDITELGLTYGYSHNFGILNLSASAGIGAFWGEERGPQAKDFAVVSLPVQGSIMIQPVPIIGLGVKLSSSLNTYSTMSGAYIVLQLGRVR